MKTHRAFEGSEPILMGTPQPFEATSHGNRSASQFSVAPHMHAARWMARRKRQSSHLIVIRVGATTSCGADQLARCTESSPPQCRAVHFVALSVRTLLLYFVGEVDFDSILDFEIPLVQRDRIRTALRPNIT
jgi:hypothetical protein